MIKLFAEAQLLTLCVLGVFGNVQALLYADSYTLSGCSNPYAEACGVFRRVPAHCTAGSDARCPGGAAANGNTDPTLCDGAPVYQRGGAGGAVLFRRFDTLGTRWWVGGSQALVDCHDSGNVISDSNPGHAQGYPGYPGLTLGYAPTAPAYGQYHDDANNPVSVAAGGGR